MTDMEGAQAGAPARDATPAAAENFPFAIAAGIATAIVGGAIWTGVTVVTEREFGLIAIAVGFIVGRAVKLAGHGRSQKFGILGAACALLGCVLGNLLSAMFFFAQSDHVEFMRVLGVMNLDLVVALMKDFTQPMDFLFYAIAVYEGYRFSFDK